MNAATLLSRLIKAPITVVRHEWLLMDQPEMHVELSNGSYCKIQWDLSYGHASLFRAADKHAAFVSCSAAETGIAPDELGVLVEAVFRATRAEEDERLADNFDDGAYDRSGDR